MDLNKNVAAEVHASTTISKDEFDAAAVMYKDSNKKMWMSVKIIASFAIGLLITVLAITGLVYMVDEMVKETETGDDGVMTVKGRSEVVRVDTVESFTSVWDLPAMSTDKLAYLKYLTVNINMTHMPALGGMAEATFKIAGAYKAWGSKDKVFLTTAEGHTVTIDSRARNGTIEMGTKGIFTISTNKIADDVMDRLRAKVLPKIPAKEEASAPFVFSKQAFLKEAAHTEGGHAEGDRRLQKVGPGLRKPRAQKIGRILSKPSKPLEWWETRAKLIPKESRLKNVDLYTVMYGAAFNS